MERRLGERTQTRNRPIRRRTLHRTRIKLCGLSKSEDVQHAVELGADAVGFVFYPPSPRSVSVAQAVELTRHVPPLVSVGRACS